MLRILGFIDKIGKNYQWVYDTEQPKPMGIRTEKKKPTHRRLKRVQLSEAQLIGEIIRRYPTVEQINDFIDKLTKTLNSCRQIKK